MGSRGPAPHRVVRDPRAEAVARPGARGGAAGLGDRGGRQAREERRGHLSVPRARAWNLAPQFGLCGTSATFLRFRGPAATARTHPRWRSHGAMPDLPKLPTLPNSPVIDFGGRLVKQAMDDEVFDRAAGLAYRFLFALFPFAIFLAALAAYVAGWLGLGDPTNDIMGAVGDNLPPDIAAQLLAAVPGGPRRDAARPADDRRAWAPCGRRPAGSARCRTRSTRPTTCPRRGTSSPRPASRSA